ncbi:carbon-nitrogen hydrolase family protein [Deinococcus sp. HMF7604]|uniref:carbon-nitrogen hydrolase family protein n=1 Tax=Deinococcus betulae TaxID=2873312 RepID=UPI001CCF0D50|nr:carbon-nitrogen hydrolase family protein [Deinococcus betulae]MBZ9752855.1 carbon-nitrogen hydrolase family protein [Deinococcus betulae]
MSVPASLRLALFHGFPQPGELSANLATLTRAAHFAQQQQAHWLIASELALTGYTFAPRLGADWIAPQQDACTHTLAELAQATQLHLMVGHPEFDPTSGRLFNAVFVFGPDGMRLGTARKTLVIPGAESWATSGEGAQVIEVMGFRVGFSICADAFLPQTGAILSQQDAQLVVAPSAWGPGLYGPAGEWEARSAEMGVPWVVVNRSGMDGSQDFSGARSAVIVKGESVWEIHPTRPTLALVTWKAQAGQLQLEGMQTWPVP